MLKLPLNIQNRNEQREIKMCIRDRYYILVSDVIRDGFNDMKAAVLLNS